VWKVGIEKATSTDSVGIGPDADKKTESAVTLEKAQTDAAAPNDAGSSLREPEYDVEVKLADMQADPNNPLFSAKRFEDLGLYASSTILCIRHHANFSNKNKRGS